MSENGLPWFAFDFRAFLADTLSLDCEAQGAYLRLLGDYYQHQRGCRADDRIIRTVTGLDPGPWRKHKPTIMDLFQIRGGRLWHHRCEEEIAKANQIVANKSKAGKASAESRQKAKQELNSGSTDGQQEPQQKANTTPDTYTYSNKEEEEGSLREPKKKAADAAPPALDRPLPSDFALNPEDLIRCQNDGADPPWVWNVFEQWKAYHLEQGTLTTDWKAAWWRRWERSKPPDPVEPPKPKARVVVSKTAKTAKTKLPKDWQPNENNAAVCADEGYDLDAMAQHFRDVCGAHGYTYVNHHQAFSNFIRNQKNFTRGNSYGKTTQRGSIVEAGNRAGANLDRKIREALEDEARTRDGVEPVQGLPED